MSLAQKEWAQKFKGKKVLFIFIGLVLFFFFDDFLMVILVKELKLFDVQDFYYFLFMLWMLLASAGLAYAVLYILKRKPTTGAEGIVGETGVVLSHTAEGWQVRIHGEIWRAECRTPVEVGDPVVVEGVDGLTLQVARLQDVKARHGKRKSHSPS